MKKVVIISIFLIVTIGSTLAFIPNDGVYYVAPIFDGELGAGTKSDPFHSLSVAFYALQVSKLPLGVSQFTLYMYPGEYTGNDNSNLFVAFNLTLAPLFDDSKVVLRGFGGHPLLTILSPSPSQKGVVTLKGITFMEGSTKNNAEKYGGALRVNVNSLSELHVIDSVFMNNFADTHGGAIGFYRSAALLNVSGCTFSSNIAESGADIAVFFAPDKTDVAPPDYTIEVDGCYFNDSSANHASSLWLAATHRIRNSAFNRCQGSECILSIGSVSPAINAFQSLTFRDTDKTALWLSGWHYSLHDSSFTDCGDSAVVILGPSRRSPISIDLANCLFENNHASIGSALRIDADLSSRINISSSVFLSNEAQYTGGAIAIFNGLVNVSTSQFLKNTAGSSGAAIIVGTGPNLGIAVAEISTCFFECNNPLQNQVDSTFGTVQFSQPSAFPPCDFH